MKTVIIESNAEYQASSTSCGISVATGHFRLRFVGFWGIYIYIYIYIYIFICYTILIRNPKNSIGKYFGAPILNIP